MLARISKVPDKSATSHEWALRAKMERDPKGLWKSVTRDNGTENALHNETRKQYGVKSFFCDTYSSWQKGGVENLNGLIRQYFPKSCNLDRIPQEAVAMVEHMLNTRPRKKLNYLTPNQALERYLLKRERSGAINS
jgi:IS30 family transposase